MHGEGRRKEGGMFNAIQRRKDKCMEREVNQKRRKRKTG